MKLTRSVVLALGLATASTFALATEKDEHAKHHPQSENLKAAPENNTPAAPKNATSQKEMEAQMNSMRDMHDRMMTANTPEERNALMDAHMKSMQGGMSMMQGMMGGSMSGKKMMSQQEMQQQMGMMQMMMDRMSPPAPAR